MGLCYEFTHVKGKFLEHCFPFASPLGVCEGYSMTNSLQSQIHAGDEIQLVKNITFKSSDFFFFNGRDCAFIFDIS